MRFGTTIAPITAVAEMTLQGFIYGYGKQAMDSLLGWTPQNQKTLDHATSGAALLDDVRELFGGGASKSSAGVAGHPDDDRATRARASEVEVLRQQQDMTKAVSQQFGSLNTQTGFVLTSFDTLKGGSGDLQSHFGVLGYAADAAAAKLMGLAGGGDLSGASSGGSGLIQAAYHPGGGLPDDHPMTPLMRGALHGVAGPNPYAGEAGGGSFVPPGAEATTAGMRQNNLGNLGFFPGMHYSGLLGPSNARDVDHSIAKFATQEDGIRAAASLALHKYMSGRHDAWDLIAAKGGWTPGALGPGASVNVARAMGLGNRDDLHLDQPDRMVKFLHGLAVQEHGPAGRFYSEDRIKGALSHRVPVAGAPPQSKTITPGRPAGKQAAGTMAQLQPIHNHFYVDGKHMASNVVSHIVDGLEHPTSVGGPDTYGTHHGPETALNDAA